ncbi:MAG: zinc ribbon domain-containing protein [Candidatus Nanoarchaeia archaeon]|nr:zinc ribbon domain-containing protein [Candidatus Nanoarchaeia archaeon]
MGIFDNIVGRVKNDLSYRAGSEISDAITKGANKILGKNPDSGQSGKKCPKCKKKVAEGLKFCEECGAKLTVSCPKCGAEYPLGKKFCTVDGEKLK